MNTIENLMTVVLLAGALMAVLGALIHTIRADGYGHRPGPRSHHDSFACRPSDLC